MKILSASQIRQADQYTIENQPISSIDLMERAVLGLVGQIIKIIKPGSSICLFCGKGNNGGDGLGLARHLEKRGFKPKVWIIGKKGGGSEDFQQNLDRLKSSGIEVYYLRETSDFPELDTDTFIIDAILGSGLDRPLKGQIKQVANKINQLPNPVIAVDIPTGIFTDDNRKNDLDHVVQAQYTFSFQFPKLSFFHRDTAPLVGKVSIIDIGLEEAFIDKAETKNFYFSRPEAKRLFRPRKDFSYKGTYGHALLIAGSDGKYGAALMAAKSCLRAGTGLLSVCIPKEGFIPLHTYLPEAMALEGGSVAITELPDIKPFSVIGMGPGTGQRPETARVLKGIIQTTNVPLVFDADALNILSDHRTWLSFLPPYTVVTPHIGEFRRLLGVNKLGDDYLEQLRNFSLKYGTVTVLKDTITAVAIPSGDIYFLKEGSAALATAGSGDVLTGIITGLISSGYHPMQAALLGVYLHGKAGKSAGEKMSLEAVSASDVIDNLGSVFRKLY